MMDIISLILTIVGFGISVAAYWKADNAKQAIQNAVKMNNSVEDLGRLRTLISTMEGAKAAVAPWVTGMPGDRRTGRRQEDDLAKLGSRLIDLQSQNMTVAASATADRKVLAHLS